MDPAQSPPRNKGAGPMRRQRGKCIAGSFFTAAADQATPTWSRSCRRTTEPDDKISFPARTTSAKQGYEVHTLWHRIPPTNSTSETCSASHALSCPW